MTVSTEQVERDQRMARLVRAWAPGERCVALMAIFYAHSGVEVEEGALGRVEGVGAAGVPLVRWDGVSGEAQPTSPDVLDPAPEIGREQNKAELAAARTDPAPPPRGAQESAAGLIEGGVLALAALEDPMHADLAAAARAIHGPLAQHGPVGILLALELGVSAALDRVSPVTGLVAEMEPARASLFAKLSSVRNALALARVLVEQADGGGQ